MCAAIWYVLGAMARSTILVIDDEPNILTTVRRNLDLEGYHVEVAGNAQAGLAKVAESDIDLILLDVMMSGNATIETAVQGTKGGAHDFVEKPLSGDKLLLTVQNALSFARLRHEAE